MSIIQFLAANWDSVLVVLAFLVLVVVLIKRGQTKILKKILFNLVTQAEKQFGDGTGSMKFSCRRGLDLPENPGGAETADSRKRILRDMIEAVLEEAKKAWGPTRI